MSFFRKANFWAVRCCDSREFFFFVLFALFTYMKFMYLEFTITPSIKHDLVMRSASIGTAISIALIFSLFPRRTRPAASLFASFLLSLLAVTDILYMRYFIDMFALRNLALVGQAAEISESIVDLLRPKDLLLFLDTMMLACYVAVSRRFSGEPIFRNVSLKRAACSVLLFALCVMALMNHINSYNKRIPGVLLSMWDRPAVSSNVGAMTYHFVDARNLVLEHWRKGRLSQDKLIEIGDWLEAKNADMRKTQFFGASAGKNLIVIQFESLQDFVVGLKVNGVEVTPNINKFIKESAYFSETYSQTGSGNSSDAEFLANTGLFPALSGAAFTRFAANRFYALPKLLVQNGYSTLALHGDRPGFWNRSSMYPSLGFGRYVSRLDMEQDEIIGMGISDGSFLRQSLEILEAEPRPFYAFLVTLTSHHPFNYGSMLEQSGFDAGEFSGSFMGNYLSAMHYTDKQLGMFFDGLRERGLLDSSVVAIYGDHAAVPPSARPHLEKLVGRDLSESWAWRSVNKVPLIIRVPGEKGLVFTDRRPSGHIDIAPTLASLLGFAFEGGFGSDLFSEDRKPMAIFIRRTYIKGDTLVDISAERAVNIKNGKILDYTGFSVCSEEVKKRLEYSNTMLEYDLLSKLGKLNTIKQ